MLKQTIAAVALIAVCSAYPALSAEEKKPAPSPATDVQRSGNPPGECEAVKKPGQQKMVDGQAGSSGSGQKTAHDINKEIVAGMTDKSGSSGTSGGDAKTAKEINKEIVENTKTTEGGAKVAATGPAKPVENWFGCPPEKTKK